MFCDAMKHYFSKILEEYCKHPLQNIDEVTETIVETLCSIVWWKFWSTKKQLSNAERCDLMRSDGDNKLTIKSNIRMDYLSNNPKATINSLTIVLVHCAV